MTVNAISGTNTRDAKSGAASSTSSSSSLALDPNQFLKLLVAELQFQDPTKPMDTSQLVQQMSSMSQVEQTVQTNVHLASILGQIQIGQASMLLGRVATSADGSQSGTIQAIRITAQGTVASLSDGSELLLGQGVKLL